MTKELSILNSNRRHSMETSHCHSNCMTCPSCPASVFKDFDQKSSMQLSRNKAVTHYKKGETLFHQGAPTFGVYCIGHGKIKLSKMNEAGGETIFTIASPGELIGYQDYFQNPEYLTTGTVLENCTACFISNEYLQALLLSQPGIAVHLLQQTTKAMATVTSYGHASLHMNVKNRVASLLVTLGQNFGIEAEDKVKIDLRLTRNEMASMIGTASETLIRALSELKQQGVLEQEGNFILIKDMEKLFKQANSSA
jgi:CRP-like cAMP-binding protein